MSVGAIDAADPLIYTIHKGNIYLITSELGSEMQRIQNGKIIQTFEWIN